MHIFRTHSPATPSAPFAEGEIMDDILPADCADDADLRASDGAAPLKRLTSDQPDLSDDSASATSAQSAGRSETEWQLAEWQRRNGVVSALIALGTCDKDGNLIVGGTSMNAAARATGEPIANCCRYLQLFRSGGHEALKPGLSTGRPPKFALTRQEQSALRLENLKRGSLALAVEWFPKNPHCRPATAHAILQQLDAAAAEKKEVRWPVSIRRSAAVTDEERALFRGAKHTQNVEMVDRKGQFFIAEDGSRILMAPNILWESDDMSLNEPFRHTLPDTGAISLGRQTLCTIDVFSAHWLAGQPVARIRDAYRVEDIADHMLFTVLAHGLPMHWRLERGSWESEFVKGVEIEGRDERWGGLGALFRIHHTWKSRGKGTIESSFNLLQSLLAHASTHIGRVRSEFEEATKLMLKAHNGDTAAAAHFWDIEQAADGLAHAMSLFNNRPKKRRAFGKSPVVPADLFAAATKRELPASEAWRFCPVKRTATVRGGMVEVVVDHYPFPFRFAVNGAVDGLHLTQGHRVLIAFHPGRPEEGCHVFNAEGANDRNREGWRFGEPLLLAPLAADAPQFDLSPAEKTNQRRKRAAAAVRMEFRALTKAGTPIIRRAESRDGEGNRTETGSAVSPVNPVNPVPSVPSVPSVRSDRSRTATAAEADDLDALAAFERSQAPALF